MEWIRNLSLSRKLYGSFGLVIGLMLVTGIVAVAELRSVARSGDGLYSVNLASGVKASDLRRDALLMRGQILAYVAEPDAALRVEGKKQIATLQSAIEADLVALRAQPGLTSAQQGLLATVTDELSAWYAARDAGPIGLTDAGDHAGAVAAALHGKGGARFKAAFDATSEFGQVTAQRAKDADEAAGSTTSTATKLLLALLAVGLLAAGAIGFLLARGIRNGVVPVLDRLRKLQEHCAADLQTGLAAIAQGDLTFAVTPVTPLIDNPSQDELGQIADAVNGIRTSTVASVAAYNETRASLSTLIREMGRTAETLAASSEEMASTSDKAGRAVGEIAQAVADVATGAERQVEMVRRARSSAEQTAESADQARQAARQGVAAALQATASMAAVNESNTALTQAMGELVAKSERIGGIVGTITGIAGQTNLLALNAAIEAARAGDQGRGFAVVADEVRKLAEESQEAATRIAVINEEIQAETQRTVGVVEDGARRAEESVAIVARAREAFEQIGGQVEDVSGHVAQIVTATTEVAAVSEQSSASAEQVSAATEETSAAAEEIAASAAELARTAEHLQQLVSQFTTA